MNVNEAIWHNKYMHEKKEKVEIKAEKAKIEKERDSLKDELKKLKKQNV